jgi:SAM-dependent methyltransferase
VAVTRGAGAYAGIAEVWAGDVELAYGPLARHLVARVPGSLEGALGLDAGAGSGVAGRALRDRGVHVVSADREVDMAAYVSGAGPAVAADVTRLPFVAGGFDVVAAAFVVNHLPDPVAGLRELRRVTRVGGHVLVSTFSNDRDGAKEAVDAVADRHGFVQPAWYVDIRRCARAFGDVGAVERSLREAGFARWTVTDEAVEVGITVPEDVVRYRLGMPHLHAFTISLTEEARRVFVAEAVEAVARVGGGFAPRVVEAVAVA